MFLFALQPQAEEAAAGEAVETADDRQHGIAVEGVGEGEAAAVAYHDTVAHHAAGAPADGAQRRQHRGLPRPVATSGYQQQGQHAHGPGPGGAPLMPEMTAHGPRQTHGHGDEKRGGSTFHNLKV